MWIFSTEIVIWKYLVLIAIYLPFYIFFTQFCVRIEKNPGLGFSISGGISGQGNPFKPSDKVRNEYLVDNFN